MRQWHIWFSSMLLPPSLVQVSQPSTTTYPPTHPAHITNTNSLFHLIFSVTFSHALPITLFLTPTQAGQHSELPPCLIKWRWIWVYRGFVKWSSITRHICLSDRVWAECYQCTQWHENPCNERYYASLILHLSSSGWLTRPIIILVKLVFCASTCWTHFLQVVTAKLFSCFVIMNCERLLEFGWM